MAMTNAEKQAAFRERSQQREQERKAELRELRAQIDRSAAENAELTRQLHAIAKVIADLKATK